MIRECPCVGVHTGLDGFMGARGSDLRASVVNLRRFCLKIRWRSLAEAREFIRAPALVRTVVPVLMNPPDVVCSL